MDSKKWGRVKEVFSETLDLPQDKRVSFLTDVEEELRLEVEKLLANYEQAENFIAEPAFVELGLNNSDPDNSLIGQKIDDYLILEEIGSGGMGAVYLAEQQREKLSHRVALKLIKRGMDTNSVLKRFVMERQILANLEHPNIGRFLDGGSTADGVPYFVMEYVEGLPIRSYCDVHDLDTRQRLELFQKVCAAVSFAHQNLIVHRDLKPSNILVTADGEPKLLDFGIAKLLHPDWSADTNEATATMFRVMTPDYASPEQLRGLAITTASDVYSLGVVLYELLTGERPYKILSRSPDEVAREVLTQEPVRPSSVVSSSNADRGMRNAELRTNENEGESTLGSTFRTPHSAIRNLKGDLDNIILKALQKEPDRRYASVQEFSEDIRRHLEGLPVTAMADTLSYRAAKFVKRHKAGVFAAVFVALTLLIATITTAWQARRADLERAKAEQRFSQVRKLANLVIFDYHDGIEKLAGSTAIREKMVKDALEYLDNLSAESGGDAELRSELAAAYQKIGDVQGNPYLANLGDQRGALSSYQKAFAIREALFALHPTDVRTRLDFAAASEKLGDILWANGDTAASFEAYKKALAICEELYAEKKLPDTENYVFVRLNNRLGQSQEKGGDLAGALENYKKSLSHVEDLLLAEPTNPKFKRGAGVGYIKIGDVLHLQQKYPEAYENFKKGSQIFEDLAAADPSNANAKRDLTLMLARLAATETELGEYEKALANNRRTIDIQETIAAADPNNVQIKFDLGDTYTNLAETFERMHRPLEAEENFRRAIAIFTSSVAKNEEYSHARSHFANTYQKFAEFLLKKGEAGKALENFRHALNLLEAEPVRSEAPERLAQTYEGIGDCLQNGKTNNFIEAKDMYQKSLQIWQELRQANKLTGNNIDKVEEISQKIAKFNS